MIVALISDLKNTCIYKCNKKEVEYLTMKNNLEVYERLQKAYTDVLNLKENVNTLLNVYKIFINLLVSEDNAFKEKRLRYLEAYIDKNLEIIFPNENFKSKIDFDYSYNNQKVALYLIDNEGKVRIPSVCEGSFLQQLIGFSAAVGIIECLGSNKLYMDEAFSASSMENLSKISGLLKKLLEAGSQIIIIEQKDDIFKDLPRREINIEKDAINGFVKVVNTTDY